MPQRVNTKSDIGTSKIASDSYDTNNIFLTDQGWVYRHWKGNPNNTETRYWDEIIVAGQVTQPGEPDYGVTNTPIQLTAYVDADGNPSGSQKYPHGDGGVANPGDLISGFEPTPGSDGTPDGEFDLSYGGQVRMPSPESGSPTLGAWTNGYNQHAADARALYENDPTQRSAGSAVYTQFPEDPDAPDVPDAPDAPIDDGNGPNDGITVNPPAGDTQPDGSIQYEGDTTQNFTALYSGSGTSPVYAWTATGVASITGGANTDNATVDITYTPGGPSSGTVVCNITATLADGTEDSQESTTAVSASNPIKITNFGTVTGEAAPALDDTETYSLTGVAHNGADDITYDWGTDGGTIVGATDGATVDVKWEAAGNWKVTNSISSVKAEVVGEPSGFLSVFINDGSGDAPVVINNVAVTTSDTVFNGVPAAFKTTITYDGGKPSGVTESATWSVTPSAGVTITDQGNTTAQIKFPDPDETYAVTASVVATNSGGPSAAVEGTLSGVSPNQALSTVALSPASDSNKYVLTGDAVGDNATININENDLLRINNVTSGHPVHIVTAPGASDVVANAVTDGTIGGDGQGATGSSGFITWDTRGVTPGTYYYQCANHDPMYGEIIVKVAG